jgi:hypothetical protein
MGRQLCEIPVDEISHELLEEGIGWYEEASEHERRWYGEGYADRMGLPA